MSRRYVDKNVSVSTPLQNVERSSATILHVDTSVLVGAALRLGRRPLSRIERRRLTENVKARADGGDPTAKITATWLACRPDRMLPPSEGN
ncbi:hypothetical protein [Jiella avicenniae]|uniref:Uncharacterized protein n=1 Tax=Jiella avicenniae TaxID=2907202 RepID=A0A9X1P620_9HYPH|nr:hypothetical protein [Jiella avicenniae]MCE7030950.1 hypothetical protein [Jiella avicenniae]